MEGIWDEQSMKEVNAVKEKIPRRNYGKGMWKERLSTAVKYMQEIDVRGIFLNDEYILRVKGQA